MGTGWRRAFCTALSKDREANVTYKQNDEQSYQSQNPSPRSGGKLGFFSNPSTPRLRCKTSSTVAAVQTPSTSIDTLISPKLRCKTASNTPKLSTKSPKSLLGSNSSSPRSPFAIIKNSLRLSRSSCGVCMQSVKTGQGMAIYTAECSHTFHFPCIAAHVKKQGSLICPVCNTTWNDVPLLSIHKAQQNQNPLQQVDRPLSNAKKQDEIRRHQKEQQPLLHQQQYHTKCLYADDEPLLSPTASGGGFVAIPEANESEEGDEEIEEFKGFFVNPISSSSEEALINGADSRQVAVTQLPEAAIISVNRTHETYAFVLKIKAPPPPPPLAPPEANSAALNGRATHFLDPARRAPIDLVTVLDVGGSMSGAKLQMMKRAMRLVISSLGSADRLSIVAFSGFPKRMLPLKRMTVQGQRSARRIIDRLACSQGSCAGEALRKATKILDDRRERNPVASIMLLSDGQDEQVNSNNNSYRRQGSNHVSSTRFAHVEIPVACYSHEPAEDAFTKCVGGLLSVVVQDLRLKLGFASGSDPAEISAVYSCNGGPTVHSSGAIRIGDLYAEEERELLVEMRVPVGTGSHHVLSVNCCYKDPSTQEIVYGREHALLVPRPQAVRSSMPKIQRLRNLFVMTRAIAESRRLVEHNEMSSAHQLLSSARALLIQSSASDEYARGLEAELAALHWGRQFQQQVEHQRQKVDAVLDENGEPLTPTSAWRAAERLAKVAVMKKSLSRVGDLHGFENARF
ncbi:hypothetical protein RJ639_047651 [Escallonia herrerae]|uniref:Zinc finger family protein n=1 Tax=Escallonia herrerae TaxID=1293975 RepID=A0AA89AY36_9ASTE|nr:hypothetical protein RJ639_047651 [Escallonia herrerae]